jgi:hypothetical protein
VDEVRVAAQCFVEPWPVTVGCLYNTAMVPKQVRADVDRTHPTVVTRDGIHATLLEEPVDFLTA